MHGTLGEQYLAYLPAMIDIENCQLRKLVQSSSIDYCNISIFRSNALYPSIRTFETRWQAKENLAVTSSPTMEVSWTCSKGFRSSKILRRMAVSGRETRRTVTIASAPVVLDLQTQNNRKRGMRRDQGRLDRRWMVLKSGDTRRKMGMRKGGQQLECHPSRRLHRWPSRACT